MPDLTPPTMITGSISAGSAGRTNFARSRQAILGMAGKLLRCAFQPAKASNAKPRMIPGTMPAMNIWAIDVPESTPNTIMVMLGGISGSITALMATSAAP
jgi:hypothetical protein